MLRTMVVEKLDIIISNKISLLFFFYPHPRTYFFSLLLEREERRERSIDGREKHQLVVSHLRPDRGLNCNLSIVP